MFSRIIDLLFPRHPDLRELEEASPARLREICTSTPPGSYTTNSLFSYRDRLVRRMIKEIKYRKNPFLIAKAGVLLADMVRDDLEESLPLTSASADEIVITGIPMPAARQRKRGWNQSELLAKETAKHIGDGRVHYRPLLRRTENNRAQTELSRSERLKNMRGVLHAPKPQFIRGRTVIVIDDVTTTGATLTEARKVLKKAGASEVWTYAVAH